MLVRKNKGMSFINSLIALFIFSLVYISILGFYSVNLRVKEKDKELLSAAYYIDSIKNVILCNYSYEYTRNMLKDKSWYINGVNMEEDTIMLVEIDELIRGDKPSDLPYVFIEGKEDLLHQVMHIEVTVVNEKTSFTGSFYRGNYEKK